MTVPNDAQLMERLQADATGEALRELYRAYAGELLGFALNGLGERGAAEEIVQEVFTRAWRHAERYDPARGSVRTWLYQIARHAIIDMRRRASARPTLAAGEQLFEIAERCELPVGTVKSRTWYALRSLRLVLEEMGVVP